jgi:hypothetical protein
LKLIESLNANPILFIQTLYKKSPSGSIVSPYLDLNNPELCCLSKKIKFKDVNYNKLPPTCGVSSLSVLDATGKTSQPYILTLGSNKYVLKIITTGAPEIVFNTESPSSSKNVPVGSCNYKDLSNYSYIGADEFTNEFIIGYLLDYIFTYFSNGLKGYVNFYTVTTCSAAETFGQTNYQIIMMEYCDLGALSNISIRPEFSGFLEYKMFNINNVNTNVTVIKRDSFLDIYKQILVSLDFLQESIQFVHGDLKLSNIFVKSEQYAVNYKGINIQSNYIFKLGDYGKSSLTMILTDHQQAYRFYNQSSLATIFYKFSSFKPKISSEYNESYYTIDNLTTASIYADLRHMGIPFYQTFDTYSFIISLLLIPEVFRMVFTTPDIQAIFWNELWFSDETSKMYNRVRKAIQNGAATGMATVLDILKDVKLKCNITTKLINLAVGK